MPMDSLDGESFVEAVRAFLSVLVRWRKLARDWRGAVESGEINPGEEGRVGAGVGSDEQDGSFTLLREDLMIRI